MYVPLQLNEQVCRDQDDDKFIACALAAKATFIISGDQDLLIISGYKGVNVIKPGTFVRQNSDMFT